MATEKINVLDPQGVKDFAKVLLGKTELQIDARIVQELTEAATNKQVPSAVVVKALYDALQAKDTEIEGKIEQVKSEVGDNVSATLTELTGKVSTLEGTVGEQGTKITEIEGKANQNATDIAAANVKVTAVETQVSTNTEAIATANTAIDTLNAKVAALTHLGIETVVGPIESVVEPKEDMLYFQKDNEEDPTWVLYICKVGEVDDASTIIPVQWIPVGDTAVDLVNYWRKDDIEAMKEALGMKDIVPMTTEQITSAVDAAFNEFNAPAEENQGSGEEQGAE